MRVRLLCLLMLASSAASAAEVTRVGRWDLHNSFWMSLHQTLMHEAVARESRDTSALSPTQRTAWDGAVAAYREAAGTGSITFTQPMMSMQNTLTQVADDAANPAITGAVGEAIIRAAPVYRAHWWRRDEAANRFFRGYVAAMLRDAGEELAVAHATTYRTPFPERIRVDVTPYAGQFGAYTHTLRDGGLTLTIASRDPGNAGLVALELVVHESSHGIVWPNDGTLADAIAEASRRLGIRPPRDLWHAILFATSSRLTKRALDARGATGYVPLAEDLLTRVWPQYRRPIEELWYPYLDGRGTLEEAVTKVVAAIPRAEE